jgi:hypothetical protein
MSSCVPCYGLDEPGLDELAECGFRNADVAPDSHEADAELFD